MKFSVKWLREHLSFDHKLSELIDKLNQLGLEVENVIDPSKFLKKFIVAQIVKVKDHPNADKLSLCEVFNGIETIQIVCGAKNVKTGLKSVLAPIGSFLPKNDEGTSIKIKETNIRGETSCGMLCSEKELCLSDDGDAIMELNKDCIVGESFSNYVDEENIVIWISITPNRIDCAGINGIARDLAASGFGKFLRKNNKSINNNFDSSIIINNELKDSLCPQFYGRIIKNVSNKSSPGWMQQRFKSSGIKIISSLVDVTNFITFDYCRPLHVFDVDKIKGNLRIRLSKKGENFKGLDGVSYKLENDMIVICDDNGIISLAGIMGGLSTACDENTKNVFVESAYFDPTSIAISGRKLNITSDARYRFERGIDPLSTTFGLDLATKMIVKNCGGQIGSIVFDGGKKNSEIVIEINCSFINKKLGTNFHQDFVVDKLLKIGCKVSLKKKEMAVIPPSWRGDIKIKEDLVEEVARMFGYEKISDQPMTMNPISKRKTTSLMQNIKKKIGRLLVSKNFMELVTWSFVDQKWEKKINQNNIISIKNPISKELGCLRSSLYTNLLLAIKKNENRGFKSQRFFEIGPIFFGCEPGDQYLMACGILSGHKFSKNWLEQEREVDLFDAKGVLFSILTYLGFDESNLKITQESRVLLHPKKNGIIYLGNTEVASFGVFHPSTKKAFEIKENICGFEINLSIILNYIRKKNKSKPALNKIFYQSSTRDFSFVVNKDIFASTIVKVIKKVNKELIESVNIFDFYDGDELGKDKKAIAFEVVLRSNNKTLSENEIEEVSKTIVKNVNSFCGGTLR